MTRTETILADQTLSIEQHGDSYRFWLHEEGKSDWCIEIPESVCKEYRLLQFAQALMHLCNERSKTI
jgi:hypothetical protein